ncbi:MAG: PorT family protein [Fibromonadales bacterium]|nr:PorT family protein [Fibromonadales bacterium]
MGNKLLLAAVFGVALCFAQETPEKLAVFVSGSDASINKSLGNKLLFAMSHGGKYAEIADPGSFQDELAKSGKSDIAYIAQTAKRYGADYVCVVNMIETFGAYSITARIVKISDSQVLKTSSVDHALKSLEDLTAVSTELTQQLLTPKNAAAPVKQCAKKYNVNELVFKIKEGFPNKLKDCSSELAKDTVAASYVMLCTVDEMRKELPEGFPNMDKIIAGLANFVQGFLNSAIEGGRLDSSRLANTAANVNMGEFLSHVKKLAADDCVVDKPYEPNVALADKGGSSSNTKWKRDDRSKFFSIRTGINFSNAYARYNIPGNNGKSNNGKGNYGSIAGIQAGVVTDFALNNWFHIQPGLMYIQKGMDDSSGAITTHYLTAHYLELPFLLSVKLSALRLNVGPYFSLCLDSYGEPEVFDDMSFDIGLSAGIGFDIKKFFHIGAFYDYGLTNMSNISGYKFYNRTLGFNVGINL